MANIYKLDGVWRYIRDELSVYCLDEINKRMNTEGFEGLIHVPMNWEAEGFHNFNGSVWYCLDFKMNHKNRENELSLLKFHGVDYFTEVWLNGNYLGQHEGYFQSFHFDISRYVKNSETNSLIVRVTSPKEEPGDVWPLRKQLIKGIFNHHDCRPGAWSQERGQDYNTGGIWNSVEILSGSALHIQNCRIKTKQITENKYRALIELDHINAFSSNVPEEMGISVKYGNKKLLKHITKVKYDSSSGTVHLSFDMESPKLWNTWDLGKPELYKLVLTSEYFGEVSYEFGVREVRLDEQKQFFLNGKRLFLRGTNIIPEQMMSLLTRGRIAQMAALMREANINIVRVHAHVNRKELYEELDKAGILVWQDFPLQWTYDESPAFTANAVSQIKDMVKQLYNHPSIAFWCCHNEPGGQIKTMDPFLADAVLSVDNSRIIRLASNYEEHPYDGWYWGKIEHYAAAPMGPLVTEFGAQALPDLQSMKKFLSAEALNNYNWPEWEYHDFQYAQTFTVAKISKGNSLKEFIANSQAYQAQYLKTAIAAYRRKKNNGITGAFQFMFIDCWPSITWSVVDYYGRKKKGFDELKHSFEPVHLSVNMRQLDYIAEAKLSADFYIINDTYKNYSDCSVVISCKGKTLHTIGDIKLGADSVTTIDWEAWKCLLPRSMKEGQYIIKFSLTDNAKRVSLSEDEIKINIIRKK